MDKVIILDNIFDAETVLEFSNLERTAKPVWHPIEEITLYHKLLDICKNYFDLSNCVGYDTWSNKGGIPGLHLDKNEDLYMGAGITELPLVGCVYYPLVENLKGGEFYTEDITFVPKTNRMLIFSSNIWHGVKPFTGTRVPLAMNIWDHKPLTYKEYLLNRMKK